ncbi:hypothetical protein ACG7TL_007254 [Trametes sanguinea]
MAFTTTTTRHPVISCPLGQTIQLVGKRYLPEKSNACGATLLFFHCAGSHKEAWEPTIQQILEADASRAQGPVVRESWSFDMPNHGEAAILNAGPLERLGRPLTVEDYAIGLRHFFSSAVLAGHRLVAIGHSLGATAMLLATLPDESSPSPPPYEAVIMVEPSLISPECFKEHFDYQDGLLKATSQGVLKRRDVWRSREQAKKYFQKRSPWDSWDSRVLDLYVRHALREVDPVGEPQPSSKVTLCCTKIQESDAYAYTAPHFRIVELFRSGMDPDLPVHWITGERDDIAPDYVHVSVMKLRRVATSQEVPDAGHFVVQENPCGLGAAITNVLANFATPRAKL